MGPFRDSGQSPFAFNPHQRTFYSLLFKIEGTGERQGEKRERNIDQREKL